LTQPIRHDTAMVAVASPTFARRVQGAAVAALAATVVGTLLGLAVPAVLLRRWTDHGYALAVAAQGVAAYVTASDLGLQNSVAQRLTVLVTRGEQDVARAIARTALGLLVIVASLGLVTVTAILLLFGRASYGRLASATGTPTVWIVAAIAAQLFSGVTAVILGGFSTTIESARGHYSRVHWGSFARVVGANGTLIVFAQLGSHPATALIFAAVAASLTDILRFLSSVSFLRGPAVSSVSRRDLAYGARGAALYTLANATTGGLLPSLIGLKLPESAGGAIPGRTVANGARLLSTALASSLWIPLAARFEQLRDEPMARAKLWQRAALLLSAVQCGAVGVVIVAAQLFVPIWLPTKAPVILHALPLFLVEQVVFVFVVPSTVMLSSTARFGALGAVNLSTAAVAVAATLGLAPRFGVMGFAAALAGAAVLVSLPGLLWLERLVGSDAAVQLPHRSRWAIGGLAAAAVAMLQVHRWAGLLLAACAMAASGAIILREVFARRAAAVAPANG
jgi:O-antigen/teichoic acid export membrane protein